MTGRKKLLLAGSAVAIAAIVGGIAYASIPTGNTITGCYLKSGGNLRVIDASVTKCKATETQLQWNQQGPPGTNGTNGTNGAAGPPGTASITIHQDVATGIPPHSGTGQSISCDTGQVAVAYGYNLAGGLILNGVVPIPSDGSDPFDDGEGKTPNGWLFQVSNTADVTNFMDMWITCAPGS